MKTTLCAALLALSLASPALAADISTYTVGSMKIVRIVDSADGVPVFGEHFKSPGVAKFYRDPKGATAMISSNPKLPQNSRPAKNVLARKSSTSFL